MIPTSRSAHRTHQPPGWWRGRGSGPHHALPCAPMTDTPEAQWRRPGVADSRSHAWRDQHQRVLGAGGATAAAEDPGLRGWIDQQIRALRDNRVDAQTQQRLAEAGITERTPTGTEAVFLAELDRWVDEHGDALVPQAAQTVVAGEAYRLGKQVQDARVAHGHGTLSPALEHELPRRAGWAWRALGAASWNRHAAVLEQHVAGGGTISELPGATYKWLMRQRPRIDTMPAAQADRLRAVPGALIARDTAVPDFIAAARTWLAEDPSRTMAMLRKRDTVTIDGVQVPVGKRAVYYRRRLKGLEGTYPLPQHEADAIASALHGWTWESPGLGRRPEAEEDAANADESTAGSASTS